MDELLSRFANAMKETLNTNTNINNNNLRRTSSPTTATNNASQQKTQQQQQATTSGKGLFLYLKKNKIKFCHFYIIYVIQVNKQHIDHRNVTMSDQHGRRHDVVKSDENGWMDGMGFDIFINETCLLCVTICFHFFLYFYEYLSV
jgi:hypothetical protein